MTGPAEYRVVIGRHSDCIDVCQQACGRPYNVGAMTAGYTPSIWAGHVPMAECNAVAIGGVTHAVRPL
jgi:hypothetical protein